MKIELWYDSVVQETDLLINEIPVEKNDIYGFLYPVRNYPLQSWIFPNGSWKGIEYQIVDLARDENVELIFHGRECDYKDLEECLSNSNNINLSFVDWDVCNIYDKLFTTLLSTLKENDTIIKSLLSAINEKNDYNVDFDIRNEEHIWAYHVYEDSDLFKTEELQNKCCCFIHSSYFSTYEKLQELLLLTRSLKIPADAIYCCFNDEHIKEDYKYYAQSFKRMNFNFCLEDSEYDKDANAKYGIPFIVNEKIKKCGEVLKFLCSVYLDLKDSTQEEFNKLKKNVVSLDNSEKMRYENIKQLRHNIDRFRHGMELVYKYIDILLSVSKDNKEEVFHYECIDKLYDNIKLYLNTESFSEVN